ncbi:MAG TPA: 7-cyano-7-deazaguanine synthase QueC [Spirochaetia bacterium]|nr:MAG: 7-cyano-7-deazaguanine synthase QueC [Spirochaetes bacterium GWB1_36_13]HCL56950.1 7-cyano-7-deazaguanine synthase QueC [Spirochaetia bacterium]
MSSTAIVLLSGGLDSATVSAIAKSEGKRILALTFDYGQKHKIEIERALAIGKMMGVAEHQVIKIDLKVFGGSSLTEDSIEVQKNRSEKEMGSGIPLTYVPARNTIFISYALAFAEVRNADSIYIGVNALDYSGYPDCRPEYIDAFNHLASLALKKTVENKPVVIKTPIIHMTKAQIIKKGLELGIDYSKTHSCYDPIEDKACGACDSCLLRKKGFQEAGMEDPTLYYHPS